MKKKNRKIELYLVEYTTMYLRQNIIRSMAAVNHTKHFLLFPNNASIIKDAIAHGNSMQFTVSLITFSICSLDQKTVNGKSILTRSFRAFFRLTL